MSRRMLIMYFVGIAAAFVSGLGFGTLRGNDRLQLCETVLDESVQAHKKTIADLRRSLEQLRDELEKQIQETERRNSWMQQEIEAMEDARRGVGL